MRRLVVAVVALSVTGGLAHADRYEASIHVQPSAGIARVGEAGTSERVTVPSLGLAGRFTYGLRHWLALEGELGFASMGAARFANVPVTINGGSSSMVTLERTTRAGRLTAGATLRLGVAWIPTVSAGVGGQLRLSTDATVADTSVVPDGRDGGLTFEPLAFVRAGLDRRINRRIVVGVSGGASRAMASPTIDSFDVEVSAPYYWYPRW